jgi:MarR family transcriptional regulator, lower aerobic nicotinate degradation pathway regulator
MAQYPSKVPSRLDDKPTWLINRLYLRAHRLLAEGFAQAGSRGYHYRLLAALEQHGPTSQAELARATGIDRSDVVAALNELAEDRCVERTEDAADRRRNVITMTRRGSRKLADLEPVVAQAQLSLLAPLSRAERAQFLALMRKVADG